MHIVVEFVVYKCGRKGSGFAAFFSTLCDTSLGLCFKRCTCFCFCTWVSDTHTTEGGKLSVGVSCKKAKSQNRIYAAGVGSHFLFFLNYSKEREK